MRRIGGTQLLFMVLLLSTGGCRGPGDARDARGFGTHRVYDAPFDTVWDAVPEVMRILDLDVVEENVEENEQKGYILAVKGITLLSSGQNVAVFVDKVDDESTRVEVVSKKVIEFEAVTPNWEEPILAELSGMLSGNK